MSPRAHLLRVQPSSPSPPPPGLALVPPPARAGVIHLGPDELVLFTAPPAAGGAAACPEGARFRGLRAIHACYAPAASTEAWLRDVLDALVPMVPGDGRWFARLDGLAAGRGAGILVPGGAPSRPDLAAAELLQVVGVECYRALSQPRPPVELLSRRLRALLPPAVERRALEALLRHGTPDALILSAGELDGLALALGLRLDAGVRPPSRTVGLLRAVARHLGTARRLRGWLPPQAAWAARGRGRAAASRRPRSRRSGTPGPSSGRSRPAPGGDGAPCCTVSTRSSITGARAAPATSWRAAATSPATRPRCTRSRERCCGPRWTASARRRSARSRR
ncbi:hypothetical protein [Anaeromyxobacter sp. PSR-1]|uniref:hypothetical protein n=1 Tax=Anaeromyxobacter sp. PSR-1 TaxID=1300915 RepID=UPI0005E7EF84|nr:hypothetical protein [Anaeromyxobacter sp. PSR-1]GAO03180.1 hypothetical protein PSR1_02063 [Anaeromyxobacter sp. PSR-1]